MAFVLEKISEEDIKKYGLEEKFNPTSRKTWAIDKDNGKFLIKVGSGWTGDSSYGKYELHYPNAGVVNFYAESIYVRNNGDSSFMIVSLIVPFSLRKNLANIKNDIIMSLKKFGYFADPKDTNINVEITLLDDSKIQFKKGE